MVEPEAGAPAELRAAEQTEEPTPRPKRLRRRRGKGSRAEIGETSIEPDSSPMVERPIDEEPPIAETHPVEEAKPKRRRSKKALEQPEAGGTEPSAAVTPPATPPPAETADRAAPSGNAPRKRRGKASAKAAPTIRETAAVEAVAVRVANNDTAADNEAGEPRRGWWQRTFG
jgi:ribonuclease E